MNKYSILFAVLISAIHSFNDDHVRWMYEYQPNQVYTSRKSTIIKDPNSRMCYRRFFVHMGNKRYDEHFLPSECDYRVFTPAAPWARSLGHIPQKTKVQPLIFHHQIARDLPNQETRFIKQIIKRFVDISKKIEAEVKRDPRILQLHELH